MEIKILKDEKNMLEIELDNLTIAEIMRVYLNKEGINLAAWKRDHPSKNPILHIEGNNPKKILQKAIDSLQKDLDKCEKEFKSIK